MIEDCAVSSVEGVEGDFRVVAQGGEIRARRVVVATGAFQRAHMPEGARSIRGVTQLLAEDYRNPKQLPPGPVLLIGSGQTGCQLSEELTRDGRRVYLACGRCAWTPRRVAGRDFVEWSAMSGWFERPVSVLPSPDARLFGNVQSTGNRRGHDMHHRTLHAQGVELLGRYQRVDESRVLFADDLASSVDFGDDRLGDWWSFVAAWSAQAGAGFPELETPEPFRIRTRSELDLAKERISTVIWTTGYRPDYGWVKLHAFDGAGFPVQVDGTSIVPGLYFVGVHWLRKHKSSILYGVG